MSGRRENFKVGEKMMERYSIISKSIPRII
jgi:hypothetical protein